MLTKSTTPRPGTDDKMDYVVLAAMGCHGPHVTRIFLERLGPTAVQFIQRSTTIFLAEYPVRSRVFHLLLRSLACTMLLSPRTFWRSNVLTRSSRRLESSLSATARLAYDLHIAKDIEQDPTQSPIVFMHGLFGSKKNNRSISK